jgi:hypothetical protein
MGVLLDLSGKRFGFWEVRARAPNGKGGRARWLCCCDCGTARVVPAIHLVRGKSKSCGGRAHAPRGERHPSYKHGGKSHGAVYRAWCNVIDRCENPNNPQYADYGGRGIKVCRRWREDFAAFLVDMGPRPKGLTIDRVNNDGNYEPGNCRWATRLEQARNSRHCHLVTVRGETMPLSVAVERFGGNYGTVKWRLYQGQPIEQALKL